MTTKSYLLAACLFVVLPVATETMTRDQYRANKTEIGSTCKSEKAACKRCPVTRRTFLPISSNSDTRNLHCVDYGFERIVGQLDYARSGVRHTIRLEVHQIVSVLNSPNNLPVDQRRPRLLVYCLNTPRCIVSNHGC